MSWMRTVVQYAQSAAYAVFIRFYCSYQAKIRLQSLQMSSRMRRTIYVRDRRTKSHMSIKIFLAYNGSLLEDSAYLPDTVCQTRPSSGGRPPLLMKFPFILPLKPPMILSTKRTPECNLKLHRMPDAPFKSVGKSSTYEAAQ